jgi:hypothetical protein
MSQSFFNSAISTLQNHKGANTKDITCTLQGKSNKYLFTLATASEASKLFDEASFIEALTLPQKQVKRLIQGVNALNQGLISGFDKTHARIILALWLEGKGANSSKLCRIAANHRMGGDNDQVLREKVNKLFSMNHGLTTVLTKVSNFAGKNGYAQYLGITASEGLGHNRVMHLNLDHAFTKAFLSLVNRSTDAQLKALFEGEDE